MTHGFGQWFAAGAAALSLGIALGACVGAGEPEPTTSTTQPEASTALTSPPPPSSAAPGPTTTPVPGPGPAPAATPGAQPAAAPAPSAAAAAAPAASPAPAPTSRVSAPAPAPTPAPAPAAAGGKTVRDGVFTVAQASRGEATFQQICAACHNAQEFRGSGWQRTWEGRSLGDMHQLVSTMMPLDAPGSLSSDQYTEIIAFILRQNGYPAGNAPLPPVRESLRQITIVPAN